MNRSYFLCSAACLVCDIFDQALGLLGWFHKLMVSTARFWCMSWDYQSFAWWCLWRIWIFVGCWHHLSTVLSLTFQSCSVGDDAIHALQCDNGLSAHIPWRHFSMRERSSGTWQRVFVVYVWRKVLAAADLLIDRFWLRDGNQTKRKFVVECWLVVGFSC